MLIIISINTRTINNSEVEPPTDSTILSATPVSNRERERDSKTQILLCIRFFTSSAKCWGNPNSDCLRFCITDCIADPSLYCTSDNTDYTGSDCPCNGFCLLC